MITEEEKDMLEDKSIKDLRKEIVGKLYGNRRCPRCGSYNNMKIEGLKKMHTGGDDWCKNCGNIGGEWILEKKS